MHKDQNQKDKYTLLLNMKQYIASQQRKLIIDRKEKYSGSYHIIVIHSYTNAHTSIKKQEKNKNVAKLLNQQSLSNLHIYEEGNSLEIAINKT